MTKVEAIEHEIAKLSPEEFAELRNWLLDQDWEQWDRQLETDAAGGKLNGLFDIARADHKAGKSKEM